MRRREDVEREGPIQADPPSIAGTRMGRTCPGVRRTDDQGGD